MEILYASSINILHSKLTLGSHNLHLFILRASFLGGLGKILLPLNPKTINNEKQNFTLLPGSFGFAEREYRWSTGTHPLLEF
jgi:hypothetical protein